MSVTKAIDVDTATPCLSPEVLATFAEGGLSGGERARALAHLADCADCREVLAGAVAFLDEDGWEEDEPAVTAEETPGQVVRGPWRQLMPRLGTLAAVLVVGVGVAVFWSELTGGDPVDRVQLASQLDWTEVPEDGREPAYDGTIRGDEKTERPIEPPALVRIGAALLDLEVAARADEETWETKRAGLGREFRNIEFAQAWVRVVEGLEPEGLADLEAGLRERVDDDAVFLDLGLWAEAGRLATLSRDVETLRSEEMARFARTAVRSKILRADLRPEARAAVDAAASHLARGVTEDDLDPLQKQFEQVLFHGGHKEA